MKRAIGAKKVFLFAPNIARPDIGNTNLRHRAGFKLKNDRTGIVSLTGDFKYQIECRRINRNRAAKEEQSKVNEVNSGIRRESYTHPALLPDHQPALYPYFMRQLTFLALDDFMKQASGVRTDFIFEVSKGRWAGSQGINHNRSIKGNDRDAGWDAEIHLLEGLIAAQYELRIGIEDCSRGLGGISEKFHGGSIAAVDFPVGDLNQGFITPYAVPVQSFAAARQAFSAGGFPHGANNGADAPVAMPYKVVNQQAHPVEIIMQHVLRINAFAFVVNDNERRRAQFRDVEEVAARATDRSENDSVDIFEMSDLIDSISF